MAVISASISKRNNSVSAQVSQNASGLKTEVSRAPAGLKADISQPAADLEAEMPGDIVVSVPGGDTYDGPYTVTPKLDEQILPSAKKYMQEDVTVKEIPIYVVSNNSGGDTVIIGG